MLPAIKVSAGKCQGKAAGSEEGHGQFESTAPLQVLGHWRLSPARRVGAHLALCTHVQFTGDETLQGDLEGGSAWLGRGWGAEGGALFWEKVSPHPRDALVI